MTIIESYSPRIEDVRKEWSSWLQDVFGSSKELTLGTYTFRPRDIRSELVLKRGTPWKPGRQYVQRVAPKLLDLLVHNGSSAFVVVEEGTDTRRLHLHSLQCSPMQWQKVVKRWWETNHGFVKLVDVSSREGVSFYVTKYVTKSDMPFWAGGPLFRTHN